MIEYFKFEIKPWHFSGQAGGVEKLLEIEVQVNGEKYNSQRVIPNQRPFETEVEYFNRMAVEMLHEKLKEISEAEGE